MTPTPIQQIPMEDLEDGRIYKVRSRNLVVGVWRASSRGFIGIREKFGNRFLFEEFHYDTGPPFGTAWAVVASNIVTTVPDNYWDHAKGDDLRSLLMPLHLDVLEEGRREMAVLQEAADALRFRPQTHAEHRREVAIAEVRQWRRDCMNKHKSEESQAAAMKDLHQEYVDRMTVAIKENPID